MFLTFSLVVSNIEISFFTRFISSPTTFCLASSVLLALPKLVSYINLASLEWAFSPPDEILYTSRRDETKRMLWRIPEYSQNFFCVCVCILYRKIEMWSVLSQLKCKWFRWKDVTSWTESTLLTSVWLLIYLFILYKCHFLFDFFCSQYHYWHPDADGTLLSVKKKWSSQQRPLIIMLFYCSFFILHMDS